MSPVKVLVLTGYGLNCDYETAYAFELAGATAERVHINSLIDGSVRLDGFHILAFVGGFSWGDDHGAGVIHAVRLKTNIGDKILEFVEKKNLVIGICNGFQTLVNLGLLPGLDGDYTRRSVALIQNDCGNFRDVWVHLKTNPDAPCVFTKGIDRIELPIRHGEGKFYAHESILSRVLQENLGTLFYSRPDGMPAKGQVPFNPTGALADIAGLCDPSGRIFGLMPHPETFNHWSNHPDWTRMKESFRRGGGRFPNGLPPGIAMLKNGVDFIKGS